MLAVRKNRYVILGKDFEKAYKNVVRALGMLCTLCCAAVLPTEDCVDNPRVSCGGG